MIDAGQRGERPVDLLKKRWATLRATRRTLIDDLNQQRAAVAQTEELLADIETTIGEYAGAIVAAGGGWTDAELDQ